MNYRRRRKQNRSCLDKLLYKDNDSLSYYSKRNVQKKMTSDKIIFKRYEEIWFDKSSLLFIWDDKTSIILSWINREIGQFGSSCFIHFESNSKVLNISSLQQPLFIYTII